MKKIFKSMADVVPVSRGGSDKIGEGSFSKVKLVSHRDNPSQLYAMKTVSKKTERELAMIVKEIKLHRSFDHPNIIRFVDFLEDKAEVYIFLEYAENGDLFTYINKYQLPESELLRLFRQSCLAIQYIHARSIMHRDLKPENILLDVQTNIKICDFGWSTEYLENVPRETLCGTFEYMAPEVILRNPQTKKTDVWALGILLYELYHGFAPFRGSRMDEILDQINQNVILFRRGLDPLVRDLILRILKYYPEDRPSVDEVLQHDLFKRFAPEEALQQVVNESESLGLSSQPQQVSAQATNDIFARWLSKTNQFAQSSQEGHLDFPDVNSEDVNVLASAFKKQPILETSFKKPISLLSPIKKVNLPEPPLKKQLKSQSPTKKLIHGHSSRNIVIQNVGAGPIDYESLQDRDEDRSKPLGQPAKAVSSRDVSLKSPLSDQLKVRKIQKSSQIPIQGTPLLSTSSQRVIGSPFAFKFTDPDISEIDPPQQRDEESSAPKVPTSPKPVPASQVYKKIYSSLRQLEIPSSLSSLSQSGRLLSALSPAASSTPQHSHQSTGKPMSKPLFGLSELSPLISNASPISTGEKSKTALKNRIQLKLDDLYNSAKPVQSMRLISTNSQIPSSPISSLGVSIGSERTIRPELFTHSSLASKSKPVRAPIIQFGEKSFSGSNAPISKYNI